MPLCRDAATLSSSTAEAATRCIIYKTTKEADASAVLEVQSGRRSAATHRISVLTFWVAMSYSPFTASLIFFLLALLSSA